MRHTSMVVLLGLFVGAAAGRSAGAAAPEREEQTEVERARQAAARSGEAGAEAREAMAAVEAELDRAVDRVSLPRIVGLLSRDGARSYRLPGYGVVFVLTPRALPREGRDVLVRVPRHRHAPRTPAGEPIPREVETLERHVILLQSETERARRTAEQDMERIVHELRLRVAGPDETLELTHAASGEARAASEPSPAEAPGPAAQAPPPAPPPWKYWFESGGVRDERTPEVVVADVRAALVLALERHGTRVRGLGPEEYVAVAVDFEVPHPFVIDARPERTLVLRARGADLAARARAAIDEDEFRRRVEVLEY